MCICAYLSVCVCVCGLSCSSVRWPTHDVHVAQSIYYDLHRVCLRSLLSGRWDAHTCCCVVLVLITQQLMSKCYSNLQTSEISKHCQEISPEKKDHVHCCLLIFKKTEQSVLICVTLIWFFFFLFAWWTDGLETIKSSTALVWVV